MPGRRRPNAERCNLGASRRTLFLRVILPAAVPYILFRPPRLASNTAASAALTIPWMLASRLGKSDATPTDIVTGPSIPARLATRLRQPSATNSALGRSVSGRTMANFSPPTGPACPKVDGSAPPRTQRTERRMSYLRHSMMTPAKGLASALLLQIVVLSYCTATKIRLH